MKVKIKLMLAILLTMVTFSAQTAYAAVPQVVADNTPAASVEPRYIGLSGCLLSISIADDGLGVEYSTGFTKTAEELGVKNVKLQEKIGPIWVTIASLDNDYFTDSDSYVGGFLAEMEPDGGQYRATITHYAIYGGKTYTVSGKTNSITY